jgi:hypothetical protein
MTIHRATAETAEQALEAAETAEQAAVAEQAAEPHRLPPLAAYRQVL